MKLNQLTITEALTGLKNKEFSSEHLTQVCLDRIKETNKDLNSFLTLNKKAVLGKYVNSKFQNSLGIIILIATVFLGLRGLDILVLSDCEFIE